MARVTATIILLSGNPELVIVILYTTTLKATSRVSCNKYICKRFHFSPQNVKLSCLTRMRWYRLKGDGVIPIKCTPPISNTAHPLFYNLTIFHDVITIRILRPRAWRNIHLGADRLWQRGCSQQSEITARTVGRICLVTSIFVHQSISLWLHL